MKNLPLHRRFIALGFTFMEIMIAIVIMGILASIALPKYFKTVEKSRATEAMSILERMYHGYKMLVFNGLLDESAYNADNKFLTNGTAWGLAIGSPAQNWYVIGIEGNLNTDPNTAFGYNLAPKGYDFSSETGCEDMVSLVPMPLVNNCMVARRKRQPGPITSNVEVDCERFIMIDCVTGNVTKSKKWY